MEVGGAGGEGLAGAALDEAPYPGNSLHLRTDRCTHVYSCQGARTLAVM